MLQLENYWNFTMNVKVCVILIGAVSFAPIIRTDDFAINFKLRRKSKVLTKKDKYYPYFNNITSPRIEALSGNTAMLSCFVENISNESISWIRTRDLHILTVNDYVFTNDKRFEIVVEFPDNWTLKINNVQFEDIGVYDCQISSQPVLIFPVYLSVLNPHNFTVSFDYGMEINEEGISNNDSQISSLNSRDHESETIIHQGPEIVIRRGDVLDISCDVFLRSENVNSVPKYFHWGTNLSLIWLHDNTIVSDETSHVGMMVVTNKISTRLLSSRLFILNTYLNDSGNYTCYPFGFKRAVIHVVIVNGANFQCTVSSSLLLFQLILYLK